MAAYKSKNFSLSTAHVQLAAEYTILPSSALSLPKEEQYHAESFSATYWLHQDQIPSQG